MKSGISISLLMMCLLLAAIAPAKTNSTVKITKKVSERAHEAFENREFLKAGTLYEKAYNSTKNKVYLENSIIAFLHYAFNSLNEKNYEHAIKYCEKVLRLQPDNKDAKEILSDIYYSRGSDFYYRDKERLAKKDLQKSLKYSVLSTQKERAKELLSKISCNNIWFDYSKPYVKKTSTDGTMPDVLEQMELKIYGEAFEKTPLNTRVGKLERDVFGRTYQNNALMVRITRLKTKILPEFMGIEF